MLNNFPQLESQTCLVLDPMVSNTQVILVVCCCLFVCLFFNMCIFLRVLVYMCGNINLLSSSSGGLGVSIQDHVGTAFSQLFKHRMKSLIDSTETHKTWLLLLHIHLSSGVTFVLQTTLFNQGVVQTSSKMHCSGRCAAICALYFNLIPDMNGNITLSSFATD